MPGSMSRVLLVLAWLTLVGCSAIAPEAPPPAPTETETEDLAGLCGPPSGCQVVGGLCGVQGDRCRSVVWCGSCDCPSNFRACELSLPPIFEVTIPWAARVDAAMTSASEGSDPVIHLLEAGVGRELAVDDNSGGGLLPHLVYTSKSGPDFTVVVRARTSTSGGSGTLVVNGRSYKIAFGGLQQPIDGLRAGEEIQTASLPPSGHGSHVAYRLSTDGLHILQRSVGGGVAGGLKISVGAPVTSETLLLGVLATTMSPARLVRNDWRLAGHDPDNDGLGSELEAAVGTCSVAAGTATGKDGNAYSCSDVADPRDTDGDGIPDGWELLGRGDVTPQQPLPQWGANPRHKDLFVEVDFDQQVPGQADFLMTAEEARKFSDIYGDRWNAPTAAQLAAHAATLHNPDKRAGISTHLDIGREPESAADFTVYGNWGGHDLVPAVADGSGGWRGQTLGEAWPTHLTPARVQAFRYSLPFLGGGGQSPENYIGWAAALGDGAVEAHESGHGNGLGHSGPTNITFPVDPNCKPNYLSLMNYAFLHAGGGFGDGTGAIDLNNAALLESAGVPTADTRFLGILADQFGYLVDAASGSVDWNRDGVFAPAGVTVRAYANNEPGGDCEYTRYNQQYVSTGERTTLSPAMARYAGLLFVFMAGHNPLHYTYSPTAIDCPQPSTTPCTTFYPSSYAGLDGTYGVDATLLTAGPASALLVVGHGADHAIHAGIVYTQSSGVTKSSPIVTLPGPPIDGEPALTTLDDGTALLAYRTAGGQLWFERLSYGGQSTFTAAPPVQGTWAGQPFPQALYSSPGLVTADFNGRHLVLAILAESRMELLAVDPATGVLTDPFLLDDPRPYIAGRPSGAFVPDPQNAQGGRLTIAFVGATSDPEKQPLEQLWSYSSAGTLRVGLQSSFDNLWTYAKGIDLFFQPGVDTNLRAAWTFSNAWDPDGTIDRSGLVEFEPKADGINDFVMKNYDDWQVLRVGICKNVVDPGQNASQPIRCPAPTW